MKMSNAASSETKFVGPIPSRAYKQAIHNFAESQRQKTRLSNGFELGELVKRNGGSIQYIDFMDDDQTDAIVVQPDGSFVIYLSSHTGALRDNFTIAHELGHKLLHWPLVKKKFQNTGMRATRRVDETNNDLVRCEWEANWFASAFLMPEEEFKLAYIEGVASERFGVTQSATEIRAKTLGLS